MHKFTTYKGHKLIVLNPEDRFPFQFGLSKAKLIMANLEAIRAFAASEGQAPAGDRFDMQNEDNMRDSIGA